MANEEVKALIKRHRLFRYEIAEQMGISEGRLSTMLRKPLTADTEARIRAAITRLAEPTTNYKEDYYGNQN